MSEKKCLTEDEVLTLYKDVSKTRKEAVSSLLRDGDKGNFIVSTLKAEDMFEYDAMYPKNPEGMGDGVVSCTYEMLPMMLAHIMEGFSQVLGKDFPSALIMWYRYLRDTNMELLRAIEESIMLVVTVEPKEEKDGGH